MEETVTADLHGEHGSRGPQRASLLSEMCHQRAMQKRVLLGLTEGQGKAGGLQEKLRRTMLL